MGRQEWSFGVVARVIGAGEVVGPGVGLTVGWVVTAQREVVVGAWEVVAASCWVDFIP